MFVPKKWSDEKRAFVVDLPLSESAHLMCVRSTLRSISSSTTNEETCFFGGETRKIILFRWVASLKQILQKRLKRVYYSVLSCDMIVKLFYKRTRNIVLSDWQVTKNALSNFSLVIVFISCLLHPEKEKAISRISMYYPNTFNNHMLGS